MGWYILLGKTVNHLDADLSPIESDIDEPSNEIGLDKKEQSIDQQIKIEV